MADKRTTRATATAAAMLLAGDAARALADFAAALKLMPEDPALYYNRGLAHAKLGGREQAITDYTKAIRLKPDFAIAYHNRGYEYEIQGKSDMAMADGRRALVLLPNLKPTVDAISRMARAKH